MISSRAAALVAVGLLIAACGAEPEPDGAEGTVVMSSATSDEMEDRAAASQQTVEVTVPEDWYDVEPREGFEYQYLWDGNDWDDVLAQNFESEPYTFTAEFFVDLLKPAFETKSTIAVRDETADVAGYPAIIIDIVYNSGSFTSFTYVDVDGQLWEFTANSLTPEGLSRGEEINASAEFGIDSRSMQPSEDG
ncbi:hypothetical protein [Flaviflexus huanghaiensis]|uniref:hypothetical protein n=1 Tax=Flaviflexus huanghaiensis TaxID=1111473 RepID=UPI0015FC046E|nr:hypothetical protein [Flaviflexus huanghaiensis]